MEMALKGRVGIFGGSFNPITMAHVQIAEDMAKHLNLNWVMFEPTNNEYDKNGLIDVEHRINMIQLIFDDSAPIDDCIFSVGAVDALSPKKMYTYEVLTRYKSMFKCCELFYIMGSDNLKEFHSWKQPEKIFELSELAVYRRGSDDLVKIISNNPILQKNVSKIHIFDSKHNNLSSTMVRNWLKSGSSISGRYLPRKVFDYIKQHKLYE